jgi:hypothetical protein
VPACWSLTATQITAGGGELVPVGEGDGDGVGVLDGERDGVAVGDLVVDLVGDGDGVTVRDGEADGRLGGGVPTTFPNRKARSAAVPGPPAHGDAWAADGAAGGSARAVTAVALVSRKRPATASAMTNARRSCTGTYPRILSVALSPSLPRTARPHTLPAGPAANWLLLADSS